MTELIIENTKNEGKGSLREVFRTVEKNPGIYRIKSDLTDTDWIDLTRPLYIAGDNWTLQNDTTLNVRGAGVNIMSRKFRFGNFRIRPGLNPTLQEPYNQDCITLLPGCEDGALEYFSCMWSTDEIIQTSRVKNITISNGIMAEALDVVHPEDEHLSNPPGHSMGPMFVNSDGIVMEGCVVAHCASRTPKIEASTLEIIDSVIYNPKYLFAELCDAANTGRFCRLYASNSYFLRGPDTGGYPPLVLVNRITSTAEVAVKDCWTDGSHFKIDTDKRVAVYTEGSVPQWSLQSTLRNAGPYNCDDEEKRILHETITRTGAIRA